jgi:hypothetical protein
VVDLSRQLHREAPGKEYGNQGVALKELGGHPAFRQLKELLDRAVSRERLEKALDLVSGADGEDED